MRWLLLLAVCLFLSSCTEDCDDHYDTSLTTIEILGYDKNGSSPHYDDIVAGFVFNQTRFYKNNDWYRTETVLTVRNLTNRTVTFGYQVVARISNYSDSVISLPPGGVHYVGLISEINWRLENDSVAVSLRTPVIYAVAN